MQAIQFQAEMKKLFTDAFGMQLFHTTLAFVFDSCVPLMMVVCKAVLCRAFLFMRPEGMSLVTVACVRFPVKEWLSIVEEMKDTKRADGGELKVTFVS